MVSLLLGLIAMGKNLFASSFTDCLYRVKVEAKDKNSIRLQWQETISKTQDCAGDRDKFSIQMRHLKSSPDLFIPGKSLLIKEWTYSAMGAEGLVNGIEYTVIKDSGKD